MSTKTIYWIVGVVLGVAILGAIASSFRTKPTMPVAAQPAYTDQYGNYAAAPVQPAPVVVQGNHGITAGELLAVGAAGYIGYKLGQRMPNGQSYNGHNYYGNPPSGYHVEGGHPVADKPVATPAAKAPAPTSKFDARPAGNVTKNVMPTIAPKPAPVAAPAPTPKPPVNLSKPSAPSRSYSAPKSTSFKRR